MKSTFFKTKYRNQEILHDPFSPVTLIPPIILFKSSVPSCCLSAQYRFVVAASKGHLKTLKKLLSNSSFFKIKIDVFVEDSNHNQYNALSAAVLNGHIETVQYLIENKARINLDAFQYAIETGNPKLLSLLVFYADSEALRQFFLSMNTICVHYRNDLASALLKQADLVKNIIINLQNGMSEKLSDAYLEGRKFFQDTLSLGEEESIIGKIFKVKIEEVYGNIFEINLADSRI